MLIHLSVIGFAKKKNEKLRGAPDSMNEYFHPELLLLINAGTCITVNGRPACVRERG
jgi:hypothetical protein